MPQNILIQGADSASFEKCLDTQEPACYTKDPVDARYVIHVQTPPAIRVIGVLACAIALAGSVSMFQVIFRIRRNWNG